MKKCKQCGITKKITEFNKNGRFIKNQCKKCTYKTGKLWIKNNPLTVYSIRNKDMGLRIKYSGMRNRCTNLNTPNSKVYGDRGIKCEWKSYKDFREDMYDSYIEHIKIFGRKNTTIDRINNNSNYCKQNCRWATIKEQNRNKRNVIIFNNETTPEASKRLGGSITLVMDRIKDGWSIEKAFTTPKKIGNY